VWPEGTQAAIPAKVTRPNIFVLYEQNIGLLQALVADELRQAEQDYPAEWIEEAFRLAAEANVRRWSYVRAILERWATEGKSDGTSRRDSETDYRRYIEGKYADRVEY
jgi:DnaD/phage-associated family protein